MEIIESEQRNPKKTKRASYLKQSLASVQKNRVLSHFHFAQCISTPFIVTSFMISHGVH